MLKYNHIFNENVDYPFHIHVIESSSTSVAVNLNGHLIGYFKPTAGITHAFTKYTREFSILELMVVGTRQEYTKNIEASFFKDSTVKYIKNSWGAFLTKNNETNKYYWSNTSRTRFFFNPEYFNMKVCWEFVIGYIPQGKVTNTIWTEEAAKELFLNQIYLTEESWPGEKSIEDVEPLIVNHFDILTSGNSNDFVVDTFIEQLQDLVDGDEIVIDNGIEKLEITVSNTYTKALYDTINVTTRPLIHVPIDIVNPNKKILYSKGIDVGVEETINLELHGNNIQFNIQRIE